MTVSLDNFAVRRQRKWLSAMSCVVGDAVIVTDALGKITFLNAEAARLTQWTRGNALGKPLRRVLRLVTEGPDSSNDCGISRGLRAGAAPRTSRLALLIPKDHSKLPVEHAILPFWHAKAKIAGSLVIFRDATAQNDQRERLSSELRYPDDIIATISDPFVVLDSEFRIKTASMSFYRTFDIAKDKVEGQLIYVVDGGRWDVARVRTMLNAVISRRLPVAGCCLETVVLRTVGKRVMLLNAQFLEASNNESNLIVLTIEDITERRRADAALKASELSYRRLFQSAKDGILILDALTLEIIDANPFLTELVGYSREELLGKELWEIGFFGDKASSQAVYRELQKRGYVRYDHLPLETKKGISAEVEFISNVYLVGQRAVAQCNIRDISERSGMQKTMREQAEALSDLHLRKDEFLAMLSHELRNPLAPIANAVHLLRMHESDDPIQQKACIIIQRQVVQLTHLVDDLMDVSRITSGRVLLRNETVAANDIIEHAVETTRPLMEQRGHSLLVSRSQNPIWLHADPARLEQVVVNLLTNAAKYTDEGGRIWLTVEQDQEECVIRLRDTGVGIAPELLPRIFDLFAQAERSLARSRGGLGVGLALVHQMVELHGGGVEVFSTPGQGSEFVVRLPVVHSPTPKPSLVPRETTGIPAHSLRVLVVDDNADTADSLALIVELSGHTVRTVHDGHAAIRAAEEFRPEVVLLDIGLPGVTGYEVATWMRLQEQLKSVVLVAITGYGQESDRQLALKAGFNHHLVKPVDFSKIETILDMAAKGLSSLTTERHA
ncbi:PAS domain-containing hybrid sensor histidine kinase/response regulator [Caballeronia sordidicola]|nr:ATP-binding protein [Caballeronia sordidicola]